MNAGTGVREGGQQVAAVGVGLDLAFGPLGDPPMGGVQRVVDLLVADPVLDPPGTFLAALDECRHVNAFPPPPEVGVRLSSGEAARAGGGVAAGGSNVVANPPKRPPGPMKKDKHKGLSLSGLPKIAGSGFEPLTSGL